MANIYKQNLIFLSRIAKNDKKQIENDKIINNNKWFVSGGGYNLRGENSKEIENLIEKSFFQVLTEVELILTNSTDDEGNEHNWNDDLKATFTVNLNLIKKALESLTMLSVSDTEYTKLDNIAGKVQKTLNKLEVIFKKTEESESESESELGSDTNTDTDTDSDSETKKENSDEQKREDRFNINNIVGYISGYITWVYCYVTNYFRR